MAEFKIESNIEVPVPRRKYPWAEMVPGDSIFVDGKKDGYSARNAAATWGRNHRAKFRGRKELDGMRIWRLT